LNKYHPETKSLMNAKPTSGSGWSWRLGRMLGVDVYVHVTFLLLLGFIGVVHGWAGGSVTAAVTGVLFFSGIFLCVLLHEFGHVLAARRYGIKTKDITLLPIGGLARLERIPDKPAQELIVALAGPAVNVVIAAGLALGLWLGGGPPLTSVSMAGGNLLERLLLANLFLVAFNLIPAFPMDGGRVLRALLAMRLSHVRATRIAAALGKGMAVLFGFVGLFTNPMLLLIAVFVWIGAAQEAAAVEMKSTFDRVPVRAAMLTQFETLAPLTTLGAAARTLLAGSQHDFPVVERGQVVGLLTRDNLFQALREQGENQVVAAVMERSFQVARPDDLLDVVLGQTSPEHPAAIPVQHNGQLVGLLTPDNMGELYMINAALRARGGWTRLAPPIISNFNSAPELPPFLRPPAAPLRD
jgi:Zn-dependent protease/CBS domain-containing protein